MIRLSKSSIGEEEKRAVMSVLEKEYLGMGEDVALFESEIADYLNVPCSWVACVNTGTAALHLSLAALDIGLGDEVLVPSITYVASLQAISATGATPVICDVTKDDLLLDVADLERRITPRTKAIMTVHFASNGRNLKGIYEFAKSKKIRVIEDAAQAFGCETEEGRVGSHGDVVCFSFDGIKNITAGEGGAVVSSDLALMSCICDLRLLGVENDTKNRFQGERSWEFDVSRQGFRYHMSNIMAAIGRVQLRRIDEFSQKRRMLATHYHNRLAGLPGLSLLHVDFEKVLPHIFVIQVRERKRDELMNGLRALDIQCGIHYQPNHYLSFYSCNDALPVSEAAGSEVLSLPLHVGLSLGEVDIVCDSIQSIIGI